MAHGITGRVLKWIQDFLRDRQQRVVVGGAQSKSSSVTSGIPQGSVLGPLLFVLYINDLPDFVDNYIRLFADDTKVFSQSDNIEGTSTLQEDLDKLQDWSAKWLLRFHPEKCHVLKLGSKKSRQIYHMQGKDAITGMDCTIDLSEIEVEKDLGVFIDHKLSFKNHVAQVTAKANKVVGVIWRSFDYLSEDLFLQLYKSLVRPMLEYGHSVWQPYQKTLCAAVEDVQRRATSFCHQSAINLTRNVWQLSACPVWNTDVSAGT